MEYQDGTVVSYDRRVTNWWDRRPQVYGYSRKGLHFVREECPSFNPFVSLEVRWGRSSYTDFIEVSSEL